MFEFPLDKLDLIGSALAQMGQNAVVAADNGSEEWNACSPAYERGLAYAIEQHPWSWTKSFATLQPAVNKPGDDMFDTAYNLPADIVHLIWVRINDVPCTYDLVAGPPGNAGPSGVQIIVLQRGGPGPLTIAYVSSNASDPQFASPTFVLALQTFVMAGIHSGILKDYATAAALRKEAAGILEQAKTRHDQQKPKRALHTSRLLMSRRVRRPWWRNPPDYGGTGAPNIIALWVVLKALASVLGVGA